MLSSGPRPKEIRTGFDVAVVDLFVLICRVVDLTVNRAAAETLNANSLSVCGGIACFSMYIAALIVVCT